MPESGAATAGFPASGPAATGGGKPTLSRSVLALTVLAFFMADVQDGLGPFLATYLQQTQIQQQVIGYTMTAGGLAAVAMTPIAGALVDRFKAKRPMTIIAALAILAASAVAFSVTDEIWLIASQVVTGIAGALLLATLAALTLGLAHASGFKRQTGRNQAWSHAGNMISAIGAGLIAYWLGAPWILAVMGVMTAGAVVATIAIRPSEIDHEAARGCESSDGESDGPAAGITTLLRNRPLLLFAVTCAFFHLGNAAMLPLLNQRLAVNVADSAPLLWTGIAIVVAQLTMIPVALWVSRSRRFDVTWFVYAAILVLPVRGTLAYLIPHAWGNIPVEILDGLAAGALGIATPLLVQRFAQGSGYFNTALGFVMTMQGVGAALSPSLANLVVGPAHQFGHAFMVLAAASLLALPAFWLAQRSAPRIGPLARAAH